MKKSKMCSGKNSFQTQKAAQIMADKFKQRVYKCPICFCYHCTNKLVFEPEYVAIEHYELLQKKLEKSKEKYSILREKYIEQSKELSKVYQHLKQVQRKLKPLEIYKEEIVELYAILTKRNKTIISYAEILRKHNLLNKE